MDEPMVDIDVVNSCRLCLRDNLYFESIFVTYFDNDIELANVINSLAPLSISKNDLLSKNICDDCKTACIEFHKFRELIIANDLKCRTILSKVNQINEQMTTEPVKKEVDSDNDSRHKTDEFTHSLIEINTEIPSSKIDYVFSEEHYEVEDDDEDSSGAETSEQSDQESGDEDEDSDDEEELKTDKGIYQCTKCDKSFDKDSKLYKHSKIHNSKSRLFACKTCNRKFTTDILLIRHEIIHSDLITKLKTEVTQKCLICSLIFDDKSKLEDCMREHKLNIETQIIQCQYCDKQYTKFHTLVRHLKTHEENKTHLCNVCNKTFAMGQDLIDHLNRHKGFTPHQCHICNKSYLQSSKLKNHMRTHSDEKVSVNTNYQYPD